MQPAWSLWHRQEPALACVQVERVLYGVDVTHSPFFERPEVLRAVEFAAEAHRGQRRKTGEPYVAHCIETACIVEALVDHAENIGLNDRSAAWADEGCSHVGVTEKPAWL